MRIAKQLSEAIGQETVLEVHTFPSPLPLAASLLRRVLQMRIAKQPSEAKARETVLEVHAEDSPKAMRDLSPMMILPNFRIAEETAKEHVSRGERTLTLLGRLMGCSSIDCFSSSEDCRTKAREC
jgi:hypothetical protein